MTRSVDLFYWFGERMIFHMQLLICHSVIKRINEFTRTMRHSIWPNRRRHNYGIERVHSANSCYLQHGIITGARELRVVELINSILSISPAKHSFTTGEDSFSFSRFAPDETAGVGFVGENLFASASSPFSARRSWNSHSWLRPIAISLILFHEWFH